jgi:2-oxoglutarate/2-oxoacid ferredoxin oxidoreductase subunit beta
MSPRSLGTLAVNTWCPGCGNFAILNAFKAVLASLEKDGFPLEKVVLVSGIGCHAKIADYLNINSFYAIHGRTVPVAQGIKLARPDLKVICFAGDGDCYGEGLEHLLFAAKRNVDITVIVHNNRVYGLTTGQFTPTSPHGFKGRSTPAGSPEDPFNPLKLLFASGAGFLGRGYSNRLEHLKQLIKEAIEHPGLSVLDVLQVCVSFFNLYDEYNKNVFLLENHDPADRDLAEKRINEWDYDSMGPISLGVFYKEFKPLFENNFETAAGTLDRAGKLKETLFKGF